MSHLLKGSSTEAIHRSYSHFFVPQRIMPFHKYCLTEKVQSHNYCNELVHESLIPQHPSLTGVNMVLLTPVTSIIKPTSSVVLWPTGNTSARAHSIQMVLGCVSKLMFTPHHNFGARSPWVCPVLCHWYWVLFMSVSGTFLTFFLTLLFSFLAHGFQYIDTIGVLYIDHFSLYSLCTSDVFHTWTPLEWCCFAFCVLSSLLYLSLWFWWL